MNMSRRDGGGYRYVAWTYEADFHCDDCADEAGMRDDGVEDSEGNEPMPIMEWDSWWGGDEGCEFLHCGTVHPGRPHATAGLACEQYSAELFGGTE